MSMALLRFVLFQMEENTGSHQDNFQTMPQYIGQKDVHFIHSDTCFSHTNVVILGVKERRIDVII